MKTQPLREQKSQYKIFAPVIFLVGFLLLPLMFGDKITISPFVLFAAAVLPNVFWFRFGKGDSAGQTVVSFRVFLLRTFASAAAALLMAVIYHVAHRVAS